MDKEKDKERGDRGEYVELYYSYGFLLDLGDFSIILTSRVYFFGFDFFWLSSRTSFGLS